MKWHWLPGVHAITCPIRRRWRRQHIGQPFWADDKTAAMLGIAHLGCPRCGRGAIEERDRLAATDDGTGEATP